jgi:putative FmdB family regulatory protein
MPIYEYQCKKCRHKFEQLQKITEKPLRVCPKCKKLQLVKLVSNTSFQLKGSGWYVTDFKDKKPDNNKKGQDSDKPIVKKKDPKPAEKPKSTGK